MTGLPRSLGTETSHHFVLKTYFPILVFLVLGCTVGGVFAMLNHLIGPKKPARATSASRRQGEPYESGIPVEPMKNFRFGVSFYLLAMLFILFDIEVVFLYPVGVIMRGASSVFVLGELATFVVLLMLAFVYVWRKGGSRLEVERRTLGARQASARDMLRGDLEGEDLEKYVEERVVTTTFEKMLNLARANSIFPLTFGLACCAIAGANARARHRLLFGSRRSAGAVSKVTGPLTTMGLVTVFVIFMLISREELRDRLIRLTGHGRLHMTTQALDEAATRISSYLFAEAVVNFCYGFLVAGGLKLIGHIWGSAEGGFPSVLLWGLLCGLLRFVPYIGVWIAAAFPIVVSFAFFTGDGVFIGTIVLFAALEVVVSQFVEPYWYGSSTGMSPLAVLVSAVFWTWLWGPVGLVLSTPLTVCLVVIGKHVPALQFLDILLGDEPVLDPPTRLYQRMISMDGEEASDLRANTSRNIPWKIRTSRSFFRRWRWRRRTIIAATSTANTSSSFTRRFGRWLTSWARQHSPELPSSARCLPKSRKMKSTFRPSSSESERWCRTGA